MRATTLLTLALAMVFCVAAIGADEPATQMVRVLKNNSNLRAKALVTSEVVGQALENDLLVVKSMNSEWVEVVPPSNVFCWVLGDYVRDGLVNSAQPVNVRAGPGINFSIVGQVLNGERLMKIGAHADWLKIVPSTNCSLWISRALVNVVPPPEKRQPVSAKVDPAPAVVDEVALPVAGGITEQIITPPATSAPLPVAVAAPEQLQEAPRAKEPERSVVYKTPPGLDLAQNMPQGQWRELQGVLRPRRFLFRTPGDFRLVVYDDRNDPVTLCHVKGNRTQLNSLLNRNLRIGGRQYWINSQSLPVLVPERIELLP